MSGDSGITSRWQELRRHPAVQAAAVYVGASWAVIQVADIFLPSQNLVRGLGIALAVGFVIVVGTAWWLVARAERTERGTVDADLSTPGARRRRRIAFAVAALLAVTGGVFWWIRPSILGAVAPEAQVIAVLPFNSSGQGVELLGEGMVDLLSTNLDAVGGIRTVDSRTVLHRWRQRAEGGGLDLEGALALGREVDASSVLLGSVVSAGHEVRLTAELYSVKGAQLAKARAEGPVDSVLALTDTLSIELLRSIWLAHEPVPNLRVSGITTGNVDAIRAYLKGQQHYRRSEWDSAFAAFEEAIANDSTFALAHFRLGLIYGWDINRGGLGSPGARRQSALALRYGDRLPARERMLVTGNSLLEDGKLAAYDTMKTYVASYPDDPEGWYMLGDVRYHAKPILGPDIEDLYQPFDRVLELDPSFAPALIHPLELSLAYGDSARYRHYLGLLAGAVDSAHSEPFRRAGLIWSQPDSVLAWLGSGTLDLRVWGNRILRHLYRSPGLTVDQIGPAMVNLRKADPSLRFPVFQGGGITMASLGRLEEARILFDSAQAAAPNALAGMADLGPVLAGIADSSFAAGSFETLADPPPIPGVERLLLYERMLFALSRGRVAEGRRLAARAAEADTSFYPDLMPLLFEAAEGWADILDGDTMGGRARIQTALADLNYSSGTAMSLSQVPRIAWYATLAASPDTRAEGVRRLRYGLWDGDVLYIPLSYQLIGQALEAAGDRAAAARAYSQFVHLWESADPDLQPRVETGRRALERLAAEGGN